MTTRFTKLFESLQNRIAFIPFLMCGDPNFSESQRLIESAIEAGADALELGIPFSDPIADGPVIQAAGNRALDSGATVSNSLELISSIRKKHPDIPIGLLVYANLLYSFGIDEFYRLAADCGVDSVLIPDCPIEESDLFHHSAISHGIAPIYICPQNADDQLISELAQKSQDYVYVVSRDGVTGVDDAQRFSNAQQAKRSKQAGCKHPVLGFGISKPEHVGQAKVDGFSAAICGSAIIRLIESGGDQERFIREMLEMT